MLAAEEVATGAGAAPGLLEHAWVIFLVPLVAALIIGLVGKRLPGKGAEVGIASMTVVLVMALILIWHFAQGNGAVERGWEWAPIGEFSLEFGTYVDGLAAIMVLMVAVVSWCVQVYSIGYMKDDPRFFWFFAVLSLFSGSMLNLVLANNLIQLLVGWELVGLCSYLIIGFWHEEKVNQDAANKAFITTKTGDVPFLFGIFALIVATAAAGGLFGTSNIPEILEAADGGEITSLVITTAAILLFGGAVGKSAQFPLHVWLPDAMAGPTPASALIHAATMVVSGIYLVGRMFGVFVESDAALQLVAIVGSITMVGGAMMALVQDDLKRVLAYSTISQLAYMIAALGLGEPGFTAGLFHMFTHAFFKALLFLCAGSVIHAVHSNDMSEMGGLRKHMPITFWTFLIGTLALIGLPPFAGFWSKDEIIAIAWHEGNALVGIATVLTALLTAFYMTRALYLTFFGSYRGHGRPHESAPVMTVPLVILAIPSVVIGFLGLPELQIGGLRLTGAFQEWVFFHEAETEAFDLTFAIVSIVAAAVGIFVASRMYGEYRERDPLRGAIGPLYGVLEERFYVDAFYMRFIVRPIQYQIAAVVDWTNRVILDGAVNMTALLTRGLAVVTAWFDRSVIDGFVNNLGRSAGEAGGILRYLQSGNVQRYAVFLFVGVVALTVIFTRT